MFEGAPASLQPALAVDEDKSILWQGSAALSCLNEESRRTTVFFDWDRCRVMFDIECDARDSIRAFATGDDLTLTLDDGTSAAAIPTGGSTGIAGLLGPFIWGDDTKATRIRFHVVNLPHMILPVSVSHSEGSWALGRAVIEEHGWRICLDNRETTSDMIDELRDGRGYAVTHIGELTRSDSQPFDDGEVTEALEAIQLILSFARGAFVATALPVGFDDTGARVWWEAASRLATAEMGRGVSWFDHHDGDGLVEFASRWLAKWNGPLWPKVLLRVAYYFLEANRQGVGEPSFLEHKVVAAQSGLELLTWTLLDADPPDDLRDAPRRRPADRMRSTLRWAGIPTSNLAGIDALNDYWRANGYDDLVHGLTEIRNSVTHPQMRNGEFGVPNGVMYDSWRAFTWMLELLTLRTIGYTGRYGSRLAGRRWAGDTAQVPWADTAGSNRVEPPC